MNRLKHLIMQLLLKKEIKDLSHSYQVEISRIAAQASLRTKMLDAAEAALREKNQIIIGNAKNKDDVSFWVAQQVCGSDIRFSLYGENYGQSHPRINASYVKRTGEEDHIEINDIITTEDRGNASLLMPYFIAYCKTTSAHYISGELSSIDKDHFDRSVHFYTKHGFKVSFNETKTSGSIKYGL